MLSIHRLLITLALAPALASSFAASSLAVIPGQHQQQQLGQQQQHQDQHRQGVLFGAHRRALLLSSSSYPSSTSFPSSSSSRLIHDAPAAWVGATRGGASTAVPAPAAGGKKQGSLLKIYLDLLDTRPLLTKSWSAGIICAFGDVLSQYIVRKAGLPFTLDVKRLAIFSVVGALYVGPSVHYWFGFIDDLSKKPQVAKRLPEGKWPPILLQLSLDQTLGASCLNSGFLLSLWTAQALANYKLWPLANLINFSVVPLKFRVLFANVVSVFWNMYLSAASNR
ncbi:pxmp2 4 family protein 2 [Nannochloropsis oceanica]